MKPAKPQARCGRVRRLLDGGPWVPLSRHSLCVWCEFAPLPTRQVSSRLDSGPLTPAEAARQPRPFGCWGAVVERVVPPQSAGGMIHVQSISSVGAMPVMPWRGRLLAVRAVSKASTLLVCCWCAAGVLSVSQVTATMQRDGLTGANARLYVGAVVVLTAVLRPPACHTARPRMTPPGQACRNHLS